MILSDQPVGSADRPVAGGAGHNVPAALASFVGRQREQAELVRLLGTSRLVTLVGTPGVGKTRLGLEVASQLVDIYGDGVWVIELDSVAAPVLPAQVVASVLDIREQAGADLVDVLIAELRHRRLLLVFDNCEHMISACAQLVERLLKACRDLTVLATSREPLGLTGEWVRSIEPLVVPTASAESYDAVVACDSMALFAERGAATQSRFVMTRDAAPTATEICRRLDGLPLAIELAAARLDVLTPGQILEQLNQHFAVHRRSVPSGPAFHASLGAALDWSHDLLSEPESILLRRLSVFAGGCTLVAAEAVCVQGEDWPEDVADLIGALVRKSMVVADTGHSDTRYRLLETIRHYATQKLRGAGEEAAIRGAHCTWSVLLAEQTAADFVSGTRAGWLSRLVPEQDNFRAAFEWALTEGVTEEALRLGGALAHFWWLQGQVSEGRLFLERAITAGRDAQPQQRSTALWAMAFLTGSAGNVDEAVPLAEQSLALADGCDDQSLRDRSRNLLGLLSMYRRPAEALPTLRDNVASARRQNDPRLLGACLCTLAAALLLVGEARAADAHLGEALEMARQSKNRSLEAEILGTAGRAALVQGQFPAAESHLDLALSLARDLGERGEEAVVLTWLGELASARGKYHEARDLLGQALLLAKEVGRPFLVARSLCFLGRVALAENRRDEARPLLEESLAMARRLGLSYLISRCLVGLGEIALLRADVAGAKDAFEEALGIAHLNDDRNAMASCTLAIAGLARVSGPAERARSAGFQALTQQDEIGDLPGVASSLELLAALRNQGADSVRLFAAAQALREANNYARPPALAAGYDGDLALARSGLNDDEFSAAWTEGSAMAVVEAIAFASRGRGVRRRSVSGWASLTPAESQVADLAAQGLTNREIGERLFVSPRTAGAHLARVFTKLGISSRRELARPAEPPP